MVNPILKHFLAVVICVFSGVCLAQDSEDMSLGNCGFAGPDIMTTHYTCQQIQQRSDSGVKREALAQLASMAWGLLTGKQTTEDAADNFGTEKESLNSGQKMEPKFSLDAHGDELFLTVAYEF